jgi:hypothetical protein
MSVDSNGAVGLVTHLAPSCGKVSGLYHLADRRSPGPALGRRPAVGRTAGSGDPRRT